MIKNQRQYNITKAQAEKFEQTLSELLSSPPAIGVHPLLQKAQEDALRSQRDELNSLLSEYDALRSGKQKVLAVESFNDLPKALIQARIAAGLSQEQLAIRLGLKEQQIQQYEATDYASASFTRIGQMIDALGIHVREEVFLPSADLSKANLFKRMQSVGIDRGLLVNRILPRPLAARIESHSVETTGDAAAGAAVLQAASTIERVFNITPAAIFGTAPLQLNTSVVGQARFKLPAHVDERRMSAYTVYAHYLALLALDATKHMQRKPVPTDAAVVRTEIMRTFGAVNFENALRYIWGLGIPVVPLADPANFHGACWRVEGRNVIVLKQQARYPARWLNDGLHELCHAGQEPDNQERSVIEAEDILESRQDSDEEEEARYFAEDVIFDGRADKIALTCARRAGKATERLKSVVPKVASEEGVPADALAYFMAYRMSEEGQNWWGAATNLQDTKTDPWQVARDIFFEKADFLQLGEADRLLLMQALTDVE